MADLTFKTALQTLLQNSDSPQEPAVSEAITFLGQASNKSAEDRQSLAHPDTLKALLTALEAGLNGAKPSASTEPTLRCIGNAIITSDEGRQIITDHGFDWTRTCLASDDTAVNVMAFNCLYNICCDYAPTQKRCLVEHVHEDVLHWYHKLVMAYKGLDLRLVDRVCDLLLSVIDKRGDGVSSDDLALRDVATRKDLLDLPPALNNQGCEREDFATSVEVALVYLRDEREQVRFIKDSLVSDVWRLFETVELVAQKAMEEGNEEEVKLVLPLSTSLTWCLSDMAARPEFVDRYASGNDFIRRNVLGTIKSSGQEYGEPSADRTRLVSAACQVLGNLLWSVKDKDASTYSVEVMSIDLHQGLMRSMTTYKEAETLHSVVGLLIQMCRYSEEYKARICGDEQLTPRLESLCQSESKEVRQGGLKLLQLLGKDDDLFRERYAGLAKEVVQSLVPEQSAAHQGAIQQNGNVVELPD